ncbi:MULTISPECIES: hypothetical protein [unclassified Actinotalea]|uniref:hypothetical protein n=1 Tax=unclassified Actinotalea TaxID=2638618 RepID=UPI0015F6982D|nr:MULTISPECIES: hypothetical protein [unclassified Actinotalea]
MPEEFAVETPALRQLAGKLSAEGWDAQACGPAWTYAWNHLTLDTMPGALLYNQAVGSMNETRDGVVQMLEALGLSLNGSATELMATAAAYDATDDATDARLDSLYSGGQPQASRESMSMPVCVATSTSALREPVSDPGTTLMERIFTADWLSPTSLVMEVLDAIFGYDPFKEAQKSFAGDWNAMYAAGSASQNLGQYMTLVGLTVDAETAVCMQRWYGDAALAAAAHFGEVAAQCEQIAQALRDFKGQADGLAMAMETQAELLAGILASIMDIALAGAIAYGFAALTSWTGIGGIVGFLAGSAAIARAVWLAGEALAVINEARTYLDVFVAGAGVLQALTMTSPTFKLPAAYDNGRV